MRIGLIAPPWAPVPPPGYGGTESVIDRLARGFVEAGHEVVLFTTGDSTCPVPRRWILEEAEGWRIGNALIELRHVVHAYAGVADCDIVHDNTVMGPLFSGRPRGVPVVTTNHGPFDEESLDVYRAMAEQVAIVAISHHQAASADGVAIARVIHHGIDADRIEPGDGGGGYFLFLGRMVPDKGVAEAARAARSLDARLVIAAKMREPAERAYFEREVMPLLGGGIEYVGEVDSVRKYELLGGAVGLVNPIQWPEPFGLVMIEAFACGTPVVAFSNGATPEIIDDGVTGLLCADESGLADAMTRVADLDRARVRKAAEGHFSSRRMVADHLALYAELLGGSLG